MMWMRPSERPKAPYIAVFRNRFSCEKTERLELDFSGDELCRLFLDNEYIASAPEYSHYSRWKKQHISIEVAAGEHILTAEVLCFGKTLLVLCQQGIQNGFYCSEKSNLLNTWECRIVPRMAFRPADPQYATTLRSVCELTEYANSLNGTAPDWEPVEFFDDSRELLAPDLPSLTEVPITEYHQEGRFFVFDKYECLRTEIEFEGRGMAEISWRETVPEGRKLTDPDISDAMIEVRPDILDIYPPGGEPIWWKPFAWDSGRLLEVRLTRNLKIRSIRFFRQSLPLPEISFDKKFSSDEQTLLRCSWETLKACIRDTFMDCPYYERRQYIGDSRIEALSLAAVCGELRPLRKALLDFAAGALPDGSIPCFSPSNLDVENIVYDPDGSKCHCIIPGFEAIYIQMAHDYALLSQDRNFMNDLLPALRKQLDVFKRNTTADGQLHMPGWNFLDWLGEYNWENGCAPHTEDGSGATLHWFTVKAAMDLADIERWLGYDADAEKTMSYADLLKKNIQSTYWNAERGCYAEDAEHTVFSEHANTIAMLTEEHDELIPVMLSGELIPAGIYFSFYILEACSRYGMTALFDSRKQKYIDTAKADGYTMPEVFLTGPWLRSRCHGWSSHLLYHLLKKRSFLERLVKE